jgi:hypothetical protein
MVSGDLKSGKYCAVLFNASEGAVCECYLSFYFNCAKDDIQLENKNWELIREEEEEGSIHRSIDRDRRAGKSIDQNSGHASVSKEEKPQEIAKKGENNSKAKEEPLKAKQEPLKTKEEPLKAKEEPLKTKEEPLKTKEDPSKRPESLKRPEDSQKRGEDSKRPVKVLPLKKEETKITSLVKTSSKPLQTIPSKSKTYAQALKDLKSGIVQTVQEEENRLVDPLAQEIQFETELAVLFGLNYRSFKDFYAIPIQQQEKIIEEYNVDRSRTATVLDLNYFSLGNKGLKACFGGIEDFPHLEFLYLKGNRLGDTVICELCNRIEMSRQLALKEIDLSENYDLGDVAAQALIALANNIQSIRRIELTGTSVTVKVIQKVNEVMIRNQRLAQS